jgi:helix-turn-helix protein
MRVIAQHLNRHPSTLYREINRNWLHDEEPLYRYPLHFGLPHRMAYSPFSHPNLTETSPTGFARQDFVYADQSVLCLFTAKVCSHKPCHCTSKLFHITSASDWLYCIDGGCGLSCSASNDRNKLL